MKNMLKLGLVLAAYTSVACVGLALVNNATAPAIKANKIAELNDGLKVIFPAASTFSSADDFTAATVDGIKLESIHTAQKDGAVIGAVIQASGATYDKATILVGVNKDSTIASIKFLSITDTPGFGQKATEPSFADQFKGKKTNDAFEAGKDVDSISGATITTKGVAKILKAASLAAAEYLAGK